MKIYLDTNVWLDYFLQRESKYISNKDVAFTIFQRTVSCEFQIIISDVLLKEILQYTSKKQLSEILLWLNPKLIQKELTKEERIDAK
jgi:predicted nucleic acid-binding protein